MRAREDIDQQQREYFLQQQIKTIQDDWVVAARSRNWKKCAKKLKP